MWLAFALLCDAAQVERDQVERMIDAPKYMRKEVVSVRVSNVTHKKAVQLERFERYSGAKRAWGKDQKLLRCNLLLVPTSINYKVILAMGRR